jgi:hypothetical protein
MRCPYSLFFFFFFYFLVILELELRASHMLGRNCTLSHSTSPQMKCPWRSAGEGCAQACRTPAEYLVAVAA